MPKGFDFGMSGDRKVPVERQVFFPIGAYSLEVVALDVFPDGL